MVKAVFPTPPSPRTTSLYNTIRPAMTGGLNFWLAVGETKQVDAGGVCKRTRQTEDRRGLSQSLERGGRGEREDRMWFGWRTKVGGGKTREVEV